MWSDLKIRVASLFGRREMEQEMAEELQAHLERCLDCARTLEGMAWLNIALQLRHGWPWQTGWKLVGPTSKAA